MDIFNQLKKFFVKNQFPLLIFFGLSVLISIIFPTGFSIRYSYQLDDIAREPIIAPFDFGILKTEQKLNSDLDEAKKSVSYSFKRNQDMVNNQLVALDTFFIYINDVRTSYYQYISSQDSLYKYRYEPEFESFQNNFIADSTTYNALYSEFLSRYSYQVDKNEWEKLIGIQQDVITEITNFDQLKTNIKQICLNRWAEGILDVPLSDVLSEEISIIQGGELIISSVKNYNDVEGAWRKNKEEINSFYIDETSIESILGYELVNEFIKPNIIFDIGANIGIETFRFRKLFPFSKIISIEANKENFNILKKNLDQDKNVVTLNLGIWNEKTKLKLKKSNKNSSQGFAYEKLDSNEKGEEFIDADTIQGVIDKFSISEIDILKIDVEGAENFIFDNSCDFWISKVKTIIMECPDSDAPLTTMKIFESFKRNNLFFNTYINGENLVFVRKDCFWRSKPIMFY